MVIDAETVEQHYLKRETFSIKEDQWTQLVNFKTRHRAMLALADDFVAQLGQVGRVESQPLTILIQQFRDFAKEYYEFFEDAERGDRTALRDVLNNLQAEWVNIGHATTQYLYSQVGGGMLKGQLEQANEFARRYYARFLGYKPVATPIAYFDRVYAITRYPFITPAALVSMPLHYAGLAGDPQNGTWQALAHELGHHIYWNSAPLFDDTVTDTRDGISYEGLHWRLRDRIWSAVMGFIRGAMTSYRSYEIGGRVLDMWLNWQEELFADICGTLMAGVRYAISARELAEDYVFSGRKSTSNDDILSVLSAFGNDNGTHPIPYLRPQIAIATLKWVHHQADVAGLADADKLRAAINTLTSDLEALRNKARRIHHEGTELALEELAPFVEPVVNAVLSTPWLSVQNGDLTLDERGLGALFAATPTVLLNAEDEHPIAASHGLSGATLSLPGDEVSPFQVFQIFHLRLVEREISVSLDLLDEEQRDKYLAQRLRELMLRALSEKWRFAIPGPSCVPG